jgi:hypothetical protein
MLGFTSGALRRRFAFRLTAALGGLMALGLSAALGFLDIHAKRSVPELRQGIPVAAGRWRVEVERAWTGLTLPDGRKVAQGRRALIVEAKLTNISAATSNDFYALFKPLAPPLDTRPMLYLERDRDLLRELHPDLPERIAAVWTFPDGEPPPVALRLALQGETYKPRDNLYASAGWFDPHLVGSLALPVERREEAVKP